MKPHTAPATSPILEIHSSHGTYSVTPFDSLQAAIAKSCNGKAVFCLIDREIVRLYPDVVADATYDAVPGLQYWGLKYREIDATEPNKSLDKLQDIILWLLDAGIKRNDKLLVIGGGVVQDIGCFIASVLFRGIEWEFIPTTLLAQCDSCIGSKSSINVGSYKNQLGTFHPPTEVRLVSSVLRTLPLDEIRSGMGEIIKLHLVRAGFDGFREMMVGYTPETLPHSSLSALTWSALRIKKKFIEEDEFDKGVRNLLNYGHTFGHAFESVTNYAIPHGIAVTLGIAAATWVSRSRGMVDGFEELNAFLRPWYEPYQKLLAAVEPEAIVSAMMKDKKNTDDRITCILTSGPGGMVKVPVPAGLIRLSLVRFIEAVNS